MLVINSCNIPKFTNIFKGLVHEFKFEQQTKKITAKIMCWLQDKFWVVTFLIKHLYLLFFISLQRYIKKSVNLSYQYFHCHSWESHENHMYNRLFIPLHQLKYTNEFIKAVFLLTTFASRRNIKESHTQFHAPKGREKIILSRLFIPSRLKKSSYKGRKKLFRPALLARSDSHINNPSATHFLA